MTSGPGSDATADSAAPATSGTDQLRAAREFLLDHRSDYETAVRDFRWPRPAAFNFGLDWFDVIAAEHPDRPALAIVEESGQSGSWTYQELSIRSDPIRSLYGCAESGCGGATGSS